MVDFVKKGKWTAEFVVYFIILFVMVYLGVQVIKSVLGFDVFFKWWNANGGNAYKQGFDMLSFALFQESRLAFNIRQLFIPGQDRLNYTDIMLIQSIAFNQARIDIDSARARAAGRPPRAAWTRARRPPRAGRRRRARRGARRARPRRAAARPRPAP